MKKKSKITAIKIQSFITDVDVDSAKKVAGGRFLPNPDDLPLTDDPGACKWARPSENVICYTNSNFCF